MYKTIAAITLLAGSVTVTPAAMAETVTAETVTAEGVFDQLKDLEGRWTGTAKGHGEEAEAEAELAGEAVHEFRVSANGTVVMETMAPGTPHEMINMYHIDGDDLVLTHYCAGGNQPTMQLDPTRSSSEKLVFDFTGGTNLDPEVDPHIHSAEVTLLGEDKLESAWMGRAGGKDTGEMIFHLTRVE